MTYTKGKDDLTRKASILTEHDRGVGVYHHFKDDQNLLRIQVIRPDMQSPLFPVPEFS
jgi:hypothetical protein